MIEANAKAARMTATRPGRVLRGTTMPNRIAVRIRHPAAVLDQTSFAKFVVSGEGAEPLLDRLCANRLPADAGRMSLTQMCTARGGVETDVTVALL
jgi:glycine cleavage system aminomethyltransferase T